MKTIEVRSLLQENVKEVQVDETFVNNFKTWYDKFVERTNREPTLIDVFYAGYILANPNVREMFKNTKIKEKIRDTYY